MEIRRVPNIAWCVAGTCRKPSFLWKMTPFDLEITRDFLIEYRKNFWGTRRTGKIERYSWAKMEDVQFGYPVKRFIFNYEDRRVVLPLREENMQMMKRLFKEYEHQ